MTIKHTGGTVNFTGHQAGEPARAGTVTLVGAGPGDPELLTLKAIKAIQAATVLLVDDLADTGKTLKAVIDQLRGDYTPITELRSAVIWTKGVSAFNADYSIEFLPTNPWIHQPFEGYDAMRPEQLIAKWSV